MVTTAASNLKATLQIIADSHQMTICGTASIGRLRLLLLVPQIRAVPRYTLARRCLRMWRTPGSALTCRSPRRTRKCLRIRRAIGTARTANAMIATRHAVRESGDTRFRLISGVPRLPRWPGPRNRWPPRLPRLRRRPSSRLEHESVRMVDSAAPRRGN